LADIDITSYSDSIRAVEWDADRIKLLDQRKLPHETKYIFIDKVKILVQAIKDMVVRGAPAIGIAAAYGVVLAARAAYQEGSNRWCEEIKSDLNILSAARPTAVNLGWAIARMSQLFPSIVGDPEEILLNEAKRIHEEDIHANKKMGMLGAELMGGVGQVLTHCNTGSLATGGYGTALGVIRSAYVQGLVDMVFACETRPWLQGSRLTTWELQQDGIPVTLIVDSTASYLMQSRQIKWVIVGADRIAANGDVANKIGTYAHAVAARYHKVGFMVVAPTSSIDMGVDSGANIMIEDRNTDEITEFSGQVVAPDTIDVWNPSFDITPASLIDVIVTEKGVIHQPDEIKIAAIFG
jgi:methylthioribose-1-phosphate isomerase